MRGMRQASTRREPAARSPRISKRHDAAEAASSGAWRSSCSGWRRQARIVDALDLRMRGEKRGEAHGVLVLARDAQRQRLDAADQQVGGERIGDRAGDALQIADGADQVGAAEDGAGEQVVVAAEVLGGGVDDEIDAELDRTLVDRASRRSNR